VPKKIEAATAVADAAPTASTSSVHIFDCNSLIKAGDAPLGQGAEMAGRSPRPAANTVAIDKIWLKTLWQVEGDQAIRQLGETLCRRQNPPRRGAMEPIVGPEDVKDESERR
jgi:hypothetical protein